MFWIRTEFYHPYLACLRLGYEKQGKMWHQDIMLRLLTSHMDPIWWKVWPGGRGPPCVTATESNGRGDLDMRKQPLSYSWLVAIRRKTRRGRRRPPVWSMHPFDGTWPRPVAGSARGAVELCLAGISFYVATDSGRLACHWAGAFISTVHQSWKLKGFQLTLRCPPLRAPTERKVGRWVACGWRPWRDGRGVIWIQSCWVAK